MTPSAAIRRLVLLLLALGLCVPLGLYGLGSLDGATTAIGAAVARDRALLASAVWRPLSVGEQTLAVLAGFAIKPLYMVLSALLALLLWRQKAPDLRALRRAMLAFFVGEGFCAINYLFFAERSTLAEFLHSFGMVVAFGFAAYALMEAVDRRVLRFSQAEARCALAGLCRACIKGGAARCQGVSLLLWLLPAGALLVCLPLLAPVRPAIFRTTIFGTAYAYVRPAVQQLFEIRFCPLAALGLFAWAYGLTWRRRRQPLSPTVVVLLAAGLGALGFSFFRLLLGAVYLDRLLWNTFWEETTELLFVLGVSAGLWVFRAGLLPAGTGWRLPAAVRGAR